MKYTETGAHKVLRAKLFFNGDGVRESRNSALFVKVFTVVCEGGVPIRVVVEKRLSISATVLEWPAIRVGWSRSLSAHARLIKSAEGPSMPVAGRRQTPRSTAHR